MTKKLRAEAKIDRSSRTLNVAMGPKSNVIGKPTMPSRGIVVLSIRSMPLGALSQLLTKGLWACSRTQGVWARNQISSGTSLPPAVWIVCAMPWAQAFRLARTDRAR